MSRQHNAAYAIPKCKHGQQVWERCLGCEEEIAARHRDEQMRGDERTRPYHDMIAKCRRWFDGCAFCPHDALVVRAKHEHNCPYMLAMYEAASRYAVHVVREFDPLGAERIAEQRSTGGEP